MINVTKSFLPELSEYTSVLQQTWQNHHLTNRGPLVQQLERNIREKLGLNNVLFVSNGTIAIQLVLKAFQLSGEIITTPFSYVATTNSVLWENMTPVFCDIDPNTFCLDAAKLEALITSKTTAILATHVYGLPCDTAAIDAVAEKHGLKVIYDAAHAFGVNYNGQSLLNYGDASTCSFHATKLFHTVEGGSITTKDQTIMKQISLYHSFGHIGDDYYSQGINGKNSEFHAAMGLCNLPKLDLLIEARKKRSELYDTILLAGGKVTRPVVPDGTEYNYAYYPVVFESENILLQVRETLLKNEVNTRRYFYPSLNRLPFLDTTQPCPVSEDVSSRVLCLPMYFDLETEHIERICKLINTL